VGCEEFPWSMIVFISHTRLANFEIPGEIILVKTTVHLDRNVRQLHPL
jgi:hypothetical protein